MADESDAPGIGVYDRPKSADRPPIWIFVILFLIILASAIVSYVLWT